ncbi:formate dehydrogenase accessory sulfurtransferase FdhD [Methanoregula sp. PtaB.Bin085]|uniref:formate dehydrogenase accessory sulfurtransferase FdhD n=1 Tax=Methanoregula sp. PtaB.Bin085 TaxID=1811680 RepID=UPI0025F43073|nr:formate dehydrogenase accessory sulfurtransferase FdhD [Methanoregula sp. PtaB.Bin085]
MRQEKRNKKEDAGKLEKNYQLAPQYRNIACTMVDQGHVVDGFHEVVEEEPTALFINGRHAMTILMSPGNPEDFVTGYLFSEEIIRTPKEIESIRIEKNRLSVITKNLFKVLPPKKTILSGCGGSTSYIDLQKLPKIHSDFSVCAERIVAAVRSVPDCDIHHHATGLHHVVLHNGQQVVAQAEDIGRDNAVDRVIGHALRTGVFLSQTFVISSGLVSSELVRKCLTANIPVIVSSGAATALAAEVARKTGMTVIGFSRGGMMIIYSHPERIAKGDQMPAGTLPELKIPKL